MKIDNTDIPPEIQALYEQWVQDADDSDILDCAKCTPSIGKGFRKNKSSVGPLKKRILKQLQRSSELDDGLRDLLLVSDPLADGMFCLSTRAIKVRWDELPSFYGHKAVAALLLDRREDVHSLGAESLPKLDSIEIDQSEETRRKLTGITNSVFHALQDALPPNDNDEQEEDTEESKTKAPADASETDSLKAKIKELERQLKEQRTKSRTLHALQEKLDKANAQIAELKGELAGEKKTARELTKQLDERTAERDGAVERADDIGSSVNQSIRTGIQKQIKSLKNRWLTPLAIAEAEAVRIVSRTGEPNSLDGRIASALTRQKEVDRHSGNMTQLRTRLDTLTRLGESVNTAIADAVHPLADLPLLKEELDDEIERIRKIVSPDSASLSEPVVRLRSMLSSAKTGDALDEARSLVETLAANAILSGPEIRALYRAYFGKMAQLYAEFGPRIVKAAGERTSDPLALLLHPESTSPQRIFLAIDGYNVILGVPEVFGDTLEGGGKPSDAARDRLALSLVPLFADHTNCDIRIFFDSNERSEHGHSPNVMSVFSGGEGEHRADKVIIEEMHAYRHGHGNASLILVTNDRDLQAQARHEGAAIISIDAFAGIL